MPSLLCRVCSASAMGSEPTPEALDPVGIFAAVQAFEDRLGFLLAFATMLHCGGNPSLRVLPTDLLDDMVELVSLRRRAQSVRLLLGDAASGDHPVQVLEQLNPRSLWCVVITLGHA